MKKKESSDPDLDDDLRPHYPAEFFRNMKPNRFAGMDLKFNGRPPIVLDADVAAVFDSSEAVNAVLRAVIKAMHSSTSGGKGETAARATDPPRIGA